jgi:AcrR family transcriptional regulator
MVGMSKATSQAAPPGATPGVRPYRGVQAHQRSADRRHRFVDAGLTLLGAEDAPAELTVRAVCREAGLAARQFYESFTDKDQFVGAVFDTVIADLAATTQAAVAAAPAVERNRAGMANIVRSVASDARVGRLLFSAGLANAVIAAKRAESGMVLAALYGHDVATALGVEPSERGARRSMATSHFAVGGVGQTLSAWLAGDVTLEPDELIDQLAAILDQISVARLH